MSLQCSSPLLLSPRARVAYSYASDPRIYVHRPQSMREMDALKSLRKGPMSDWARDEAGFVAFRQGIWERNVKVVRGLLDDDIMDHTQGGM